VKICGGLLSIVGAGADAMACIFVDFAASAALAPLAIAGAVVSFLGYGIKAWIFPETKPIGLWAEHGPFGKLPFMGYKQGAPTNGQSLATANR
jgi:hypothetical protein